MEALQLSREALHQRGGLLDQMLDKLFDNAILVDDQCRILYLYRTIARLLKQVIK